MEFVNSYGETLDDWMDRITADLDALGLDIGDWDYNPRETGELWILGVWWETGADADEIAPMIRAAMEGGAGS